jgi:acetyl-CoA acetyltransferase
MAREVAIVGVGQTKHGRRDDVNYPELVYDAVKAAIDFARMCKHKKEKKIIVFANSGHGHFDLASYDAYNRGILKDFEYPKKQVEKSMKELPEI